MLGYELVLSPAAKRDLKRLPIKIQNDIVEIHLPIIADNPVQRGKPLVGALRYDRCYHFGRKPEYRIVYHLEGRLITVTLVGSREGLYQKALKRRKTNR
jgi:mRNA-degrading endonuclease RelE of RelBE toxin-antitoxin system